MGGLGLGLIVGLLGALFLCMRDKRKHMRKDSLSNLQGTYIYAPSFGSRYQAVPNPSDPVETSLGHSASSGFSNRVNRLAADSQYQVEPFVLSSTTGDVHSSSTFAPTQSPSNPSLRSPSSVPDQGAQRNPGQQIYVVHHDSGRAPVTVFTQEGAHVVELPPGYPEDTVERHNSAGLHAGRDVRNMAGSSHGWDHEENELGRAEMSIDLQPIRHPGNISKQRRPRS